MKVKVLRYNKDGDFHQCLTDEGHTIYLDLFTDKHIENENPESIVGKIVHYESDSPYISIATGVYKVED